MSVHSSPGSAEWTQDSREPDSPMCSSPSPTSGDAPSSPTIGPECPATTTFALSENQRGELLLTRQAHQLTQGGASPVRGSHA